jgi:hypothetical protein
VPAAWERAAWVAAELAEGVAAWERAAWVAAELAEGVAAGKVGAKLQSALCPMC